MKALNNGVLLSVKSTEKELSVLNGIYLPVANNNPVANVVTTATVYESDNDEFKKGDKIWINPNLVYTDVGNYKPYIKVNNEFVFSVNNQEDLSWSIYLIEREGVLIPTKRWTLLKRMYINADSIVDFKGNKIQLSKSGLCVKIGEDKSVRMGEVFLSNYVNQGDIVFYSNKIAEKLVINVNNVDYLRVRNPHNEKLPSGGYVECEDDVLAIAVK